MSVHSVLVKMKLQYSLFQQVFKQFSAVVGSHHNRSLSLDFVLSQFNPAHIYKIYFYRNHFTITYHL